jgi:hypothetical protein
MGAVVPNDTKMPRGIGMVPPITDPTQAPSADRVVLIDPMTKEVISRVARSSAAGTAPVLDKTGRQVLEDNDFWFILKFKLLWKEVPAAAIAMAGQSAMGTMGPSYGVGATPPGRASR